MNIEKYLGQVLSDENIINKTYDKNVFYIHAKSATPQYVEYMIVNDPTSFYEENEEKNINYLIQVDIFSKGDFTELKDTIIKHLKENGFDRGTSSPDMYEEDTELYHKALRFNVESFIFEDL